MLAPRGARAERNCADRLRMRLGSADDGALKSRAHVPEDERVRHGGASGGHLCSSRLPVVESERRSEQPQRLALWLRRQGPLDEQPASALCSGLRQLATPPLNRGPKLRGATANAVDTRAGSCASRRPHDGRDRRVVLPRGQIRAPVAPQDKVGGEGLDHTLSRGRRRQRRWRGHVGIGGRPQGLRHRRLLPQQQRGELSVYVDSEGRGARQQPQCRLEQGQLRHRRPVGRSGGSLCGSQLR
mmetsp:Transcript_36059/g.118710  ORF Transcript_36059/g.118710 Transcript_36059/m.118710 type:complete len:242 (+) Transcript_36059:2116-2841(+)